MIDEEEIGSDEKLVEIEEKIYDLRAVKEPTAEQREELQTLQTERKSRLSKRTTVLLGRTKAAEEKARQAEERVRQLEERANKFEKSVAAPKTHQKVTFDGDDFYTDQALQSMVSSGEMTEQAAWDHQEDRRVAAAAERMSKKSEKQSFEKVRQETISSVLKEYPQLNPSNAKYNLDDPFTAEVDRLLRNGYQFKPEGLKNAVEDAKRNLRITDKRADLSEELSVTRGGGNSDTPRAKGKKVELEDWEAENAVRMYVNTGMTNPKTGKIYTKVEAVEKALIAKTKRAEEMATR